jgi:hypothetical protein
VILLVAALRETLGESSNKSEQEFIRTWAVGYSHRKAPLAVYFPQLDSLRELRVIPNLTIVLKNLADDQITRTLVIGKADQFGACYQFKPARERGFRVNVMLPTVAAEQRIHVHVPFPITTEAVIHLNPIDLFPSQGQASRHPRRSHLSEVCHWMLR